MTATILQPEYLLPTADPDSLQNGMAIAIAGNHIAAVDSPGVLQERWPEARTEDLDGCIVMPGLVNAHQHGRGISQIQLGYADDFLELWINSRRARGSLDPYPTTKLAAACMIENGVTSTVHANYSYGSGDYEAEARAALRAYDESGLRVTFCVGAMDRGFVVYPPHEEAFLAGLPADLRDWVAVPAGQPYAGDGAATTALMGRLLSDFGDHPRIRLCYGPAGLQWVTDEMLATLARDADAKGLGLHIHAAESPAQQATLAALYPDGAFGHMADLGALTPRTALAHGVYLDDRDIETIAHYGAVVVRNPGSNLRLHNGAAPLAKLLAAGVPVAIGTDNSGLADDEDLLGELRLATELARVPDWHGPAAPTPTDKLQMLTLNGAKAAQTAPDVGRITPGARADLVALSLDRTRQPYLDPDMPLIDAMLARARGDDVKLTMVDGAILYQDGALTGIDKPAIAAEAADAARAGRGPRDPDDIRRMQTLRQHIERHYRETLLPAGGGSRLERHNDKEG